MRALALSGLLLVAAFPATGRASDCLEDPEIKGWYYGGSGAPLTDDICGRVPDDCSTSLPLNPPGSQVYYIRSECFFRLAKATGDAGNCAEVKEAKSSLLDGSDYTPERCKAVVKRLNDQKAADQKSRKEAYERGVRANEAALKKWSDEQDALNKKRYDAQFTPEAKNKKFRELKAEGVVWWGGWDMQCNRNRCRYDGSDVRTNRCGTDVCAPRAYYQCARQKPPLRFENDSRVLNLIHAKACGIYAGEIDAQTFTVPPEERQSPPKRSPAGRPPAAAPADEDRLIVPP